MTERSSPFMSLWRPFEMGKEHNTLKALKKYRISAVQALVRLNVSLLFYLLPIFAQSVGPNISILWRNVQKWGHLKKISNFPCANTLTWTELLVSWPPPPPLTACRLCLSQSFYLSLFSFTFFPSKFNLVFCSDGEELGSFMPDTVEYIKLQQKYK